MQWKEMIRKEHIGGILQQEMLAKQQVLSTYYYVDVDRTWPQ